MRAITEQAPKMPPRRPGFLAALRARACAAQCGALVLLALVLLCVGPAVSSARAECPNELLRIENDSTALPECRAYEQVSSPFTNGFAVSTGTGSVFNESSASVPYSSIGGFAGTPAAGANISTYYLATRTASGWATAPLEPPASQFPAAFYEGVVGPDPGSTLSLTRTSSQPATVATFYLRRPDGSFAAVGPAFSPALTTGPPSKSQSPGLGMGTVSVEEGGFSPAGPQVFFTLGAQSGRPRAYWPGDATSTSSSGTGEPSLYEYLGTGHSGEGSDVPSLVGLDNGGAQLTECGTRAGRSGETYNDISAQGTTVFLEAAAGGCNTTGTGPAVAQLYARIGDPGETQATVNLAGTAGCAASISCNVTVAPRFEGASEDGSKVFFTTTQQLLAADQDTTNDLYECELPGDSGSTPAPVAKVDPCPALVPVSVTGTASGAEVQGVARISEDGSHVYYVAKGAITPPGEENENGEHAEAGKDNLYVYEPEPGNPGHYHNVFVAILSASDSADWASTDERQVNATPDGRYLLFPSVNDLTPDDTSSVAQLFRYDAADGELTRVSVGQDGFNDDGNTSTDPAEIPKQFYRATSGPYNRSPLVISNDGSFVAFTSSAALTPQVTTGNYNVYLWHEGAVSLISDGTNVSPSGKAHTGVAGISPTGADLFFEDPAQLTPTDTGTSPIIYDARIDGGFPYVAPTSCDPLEEAACQGPPTEAPAGTVPATPAFSGPGNEPTPRPAKKPNPKRHHRKKHHRKKHHVHHAKRAADHDRRASR